MRVVYREREVSVVNKVILMGRLTRNPDIRYTQGNEPMAIARYTLAVDRRVRRENEQTADFIGCVAFSKQAEFAERYLHQGTKIVVEGHIQTGSYTNKDGQKVYTTEVVVENTEFAESKNANGSSTEGAEGTEASRGSSRPEPGLEPAPDGFMNIPEGLEDEGLPFN